MAQKTQQGRKLFNGILIALDPGETTGYAVFDVEHGIQLIDAGQLPTWPLEEAVRRLGKLYETHSPDYVVYEAYHVYKWKLEEHTFSRVPTIQIIGALRTLAILMNVEHSEQTAQVGKGFCTDDKLRMWGFYLEGLRHARDAIRHGCHWLLFHRS